LHLDTTTFNLLKKEATLAKHVINCNSIVENHYGRPVSDETIEFLRNITSRDYAEKVFGSYFLDSQFGKYLGHLATNAELIERAEENNDFLRENINFLPESYLVKFKDKDLFKQVVGNRTYRENKYFAYDFLKVLDKIAA